MQTCQALTKSGGPCRGPAGGSGYCYSHDPAVSPEERREVRANGGRNSAALSRVVCSMPAHFRRVYDLLMQSMEDVASGKGEPQRLTALSTGARALVALVEVGELAAKVEAMEETLRKVQAQDEPHA